MSDENEEKPYFRGFCAPIDAYIQTYEIPLFMGFFSGFLPMKKKNGEHSTQCSQVVNNPFY